ncbi:MAG: DUF3343 domain-containing protein [Eubacterium sp.]|nr:DUF3343 domain-containing protein [Eubacterium sp.]
MTLFIKVGSITNAQRGQRLLRSGGYKAQIKRIENPSKADGCGYALEVNASDDEPVNILQRNRITIRGVEVI